AIRESVGLMADRLSGPAFHDEPPCLRTTPPPREGITTRSFPTALAIAATAASISSRVVKRERENRTLPRARAEECPIARTMRLGFTAPVLQADPGEQQTPASSRRMRSPSPSTPGK